MSRSVVLLRIIHGMFTLYFTCCLVYVYYCAVTKRTDLFLNISVVSLLLEGILIYIFNHGDCPLIHIQRKIGDDIPFFALFLPKKLASSAIPIFAVCTICGLFVLVLRLSGKL